MHWHPVSPMRLTQAGHTLAALATTDSSLHEPSVRQLLPPAPL